MLDDFQLKLSFKSYAPVFYTPNPRATRRANELIFEVPGEVIHLPEGASCQVEILKPKISLLRSWFTD